MEIEFEDPDYDRLEVDLSFTLGFARHIVTMYRKRIAFIRAARDERDFYAMHGLRFEKLHGDREGQHSMRLNDQWRLTMRLQTRDTAKIVVLISIVDYHK